MFLIIKYLISSSFLVVIAFSSANAAIKDSIVKLRINDTDIATGFFIDDTGTILTAYHTVCGFGSQRTEKIEIFQKGKFIGQPSVIGYDSLKDIALLKLNVNSKPLLLANDVETIEAALKLRKGDTYGYPDGKPLSRVEINFSQEFMIKAEDYVFPGNMQYFSLDAWNVPLIQFNASISAGMSGGPILAGGKVVGLISGTQAIQGDTFGWAIPTNIVASIDRRSPITGEDLKRLDPLRLIVSDKTEQFIKGMRYVDFGEIENLEVLVVSDAAWWERIERHDEIKSYFDRGINFKQVTLSQPYEKFIIRQEYLRMKKLPKFDHSIDFEKYLEKRNLSYTRKDVKIINEYDIDHTPTFIALYDGKEIGRFKRVNNVIQYLYWKNKGQEHIKANSFGFENEQNKESFISFLNGIIDVAKKNQYAKNKLQAN